MKKHNSSHKVLCKATMAWFGLNISNGSRASMTIFSVTFFLLMLTLLTLGFGQFEWFSKAKILIGRAQNMTTQVNMAYQGSKDNDVDRLFDGLIIPSRFEEKSCLSRYESYLYRKSSPHKPSPYLLSKLRSYEDLHTNCGPHSRAYKRTMVNLKKFRFNNVTNECKYIVWTPANGLGNRMVSISAAFLYAILTDRVLLMEFQDDMIDLFCEPFPNSTWILPHDFPFKKGHVETYQNMLRKHKENNSTLLPSVLYLNIVHSSSNDKGRFFCCDHSQHLLHEIPLLILQADQYFVPSIFMVPSFNNEVKKMFPDKDTIFHHLGRYIFLPSNSVWGPITRFYKAYLANSDEKIGFQIRVFTPDRTPYQTIMTQLLNCTQTHKILPDLATEGKISEWKNQSLKSVLVTSLYPEYGEKLKSMYLSKATVTGESVGVYQPSHEEQQKFGDKMHNMKAWTEIYLLSLCDVLVTSSLSTFGYVAQSLGGIKPWILYKIIGKDVPDVACVRDVSMEPCFHIPPNVDCKGNAIDGNIAALFPYMRRCLDYDSGVKLVNDHQYHH